MKQIPEALLAKLWRARAARRRSLTTQDGAKLRVLYPGRPSTAAGPDFRDAVLELPGKGVFKGDVEIHVRQRDWRGHGHHLDPNYDGVVLHAALKTNASEDTPRACGGTVPIVSLEPLLDGRSCARPAADPWTRLARRGFRKPASAEEMGRLLDRAGDQRFLTRARGLGRRLAREEPCQVLYEALLETLGYSRNRKAFRELARRVPYQEVRELALNGTPAERRRLVTGAMLRGCEGLEWHTFRVRPSNHPHRRVVGAAVLVCRYLDKGLVEGLEQPVRHCSWRALVGAIETRGDDGGALVGRGRAGDAAVNVVLPFFHARGRLRRDASLRDASLKLYRDSPPLQENELTREMQYLILPPGWKGLACSAGRQQGLIHLYRLLTWAEDGRSSS